MSVTTLRYERCLLPTLGSRCYPRGCDRLPTGVKGRLFPPREEKGGLFPPRRGEREGLGTTQGITFSPRETERECTTNPAQKGVLHKECQKGESSTFLTKSVILVTYESPSHSALKTTILTVRDQKRPLFQPRKGRTTRRGLCPTPP